MRAKRTDTRHAEVARAFKLLGLSYMDTSGAGNGLEDYIVAIPGSTEGPTAFNPLRFKHPPYWLVCEVKTRRNKTGKITCSQYTDSQIAWRAKTEGWPRITVISFEDAFNQLRALTGLGPKITASRSGS